MKNESEFPSTMINEMRATARDPETGEPSARFGT